MSSISELLKITKRCAAFVLKPSLLGFETSIHLASLAHRIGHRSSVYFNVLIWVLAQRSLPLYHLSLIQLVGGQETRTPSRHFYILYAMYRSIDTNHTSLKMASQRCMSLEIHPRFHSLGLDESIINTRSVGFTIQPFTVPMIRFNKSRLQVIQEGNNNHVSYSSPFLTKLLGANKETSKSNLAGHMAEAVAYLEMSQTEWTQTIRGV